MHLQLCFKKEEEKMEKGMRRKRKKYGVLEQIRRNEEETKERWRTLAD